MSETKEMAMCALLSVIAAVIFKLEALIPFPTGIPFVKLGLANAVTLFTLFIFGERQAVSVLICRIFLCFLFGGNGVSLIYSLCGGAVSMGSCIVFKKLCSAPIWFFGVIGAIMHNGGQLVAAALVMHTFAVWAYLPVMLIAGCVTGVCSGILSEISYRRIKKMLKSL